MAPYLPRLRRATLEDSHWIDELAKSGGLTFSLRGTLSVAHQTVTVAEAAAGKGVGFVALSELADEFELTDLCVAPDARRQGIGRSLVEWAQDHARQLSASSVYLEVRSQNHAALGLYRELGFEELGRRSGYYRSPTDDALLLGWQP